MSVNAEKGHDIWVLFNKLDEETKCRVMEHYLSQQKEESKDTLLEKIEEHKSAFVDWRYPYEDSQCLKCSPAFLYSFAYGLNTFIEQNYHFERNDNGWLKADGVIKFKAQ